MRKGSINQAFVVSRATPSDAATLLEIAVEASIDAWTPDDYSEEMCRKDSVVLKAENGSSMIGFLVARTVPGSTSGIDADLYNIAVLKRFHRQGVGSILLAALQKELIEREVQHIWLEVRSSNSTAIHFYKKHGFELFTSRANFYSNPSEDAIIMRLSVVEK